MWGGDRAFIDVATNVDGAAVTLIDINHHVVSEQKTAKKGDYFSTEFILYTTAAPVECVIIEADGYYTGYSAVHTPAAGKTQTYKVDLIKKETMMGGNRGVIDVETNVIGAKVELFSISGSSAGIAYTNDDGLAELPVYTTGTPVNKAVISANGFETQTISVSMPGSGATMKYIVQLKSNAAPTVPTPIPTKSPIGFSIIAGLGVLGAAALLRRD